MLDAFASRDIDRARAVWQRDQDVDEHYDSIFRELLTYMMADPRTITSCAHLLFVAKNIAKRALVIAESDPITPLTRSIERMGELVAGRLKDVLDAFAARDIDRAKAVWQRDNEVDEHYDSIFRELLTYMMADPRTITSCAHLLFVAKNLERIGDHATNIAEIILYEVTGEQITDQRPKLDSLER